MTLSIRHLLPLLIGALSLAIAVVSFARGKLIVATFAAAAFGVILVALATYLLTRTGSNYRQLRAEHEKLRLQTRNIEDLLHETRTVRIDEDQLLKVMDRMTPVITQTVARDWSINANRITARYELIEDELRGLLDKFEERAIDGEVLDEKFADLLSSKLTHLDRMPTTATVRLIVTEAVSEVDALLRLRDRVDMPPNTPVLGGWALSPRAMLRALELIDEHEPSLVVECGSGVSTVYIARALQKLGRGRVVSLEHDHDFYRETRARLVRSGLDGLAEVRHAPLVDIDVHGATYGWYDMNALSDISSVDMLLVDGPPGATGPLARYPAVAQLHDRLSADALVLLDDATRTDEKQVIQRWEEDFGYQRVGAAKNDLAVLVPPASQWTTQK